MYNIINLQNTHISIKNALPTLLGLTVSIGLGALVIFNSLSASLTDTPGTPYEQAFDKLTQWGIVEGYPDGTGQPNGMLKRAEALAVIMRAQPDIMRRVEAYSQQMPPARRFIDEDRSQWYAPYVLVAYEEGIAKGYPDDSFRPGQILRVEEAVALLIRSFKYDLNRQSFLVSPHIENKLGEWFSPYINLAIEKNLIIADRYKLQLDQAITRGQFFEMLFRLLVVRQAGVDYFTAEAVSIAESKSDNYQQTQQTVKQLPGQELTEVKDSNPFKVEIGPAPLITETPVQDYDPAVYNTIQTAFQSSSSADSTQSADVWSWWREYYSNQYRNSETETSDGTGQYNYYTDTGYSDGNYQLPETQYAQQSSAALPVQEPLNQSSQSDKWASYYAEQNNPTPAKKISSSAAPPVQNVPPATGTVPAANPYYQSDTDKQNNTTQIEFILKDENTPLGPVPVIKGGSRNTESNSAQTAMEITAPTTNSDNYSDTITHNQVAQYQSSSPQNQLPAYASLQDFAISMPTLGIENLRISHPSDPSSQEGILSVLDRGVGHLFSFPGGGGKIMVYGHSSGYWWDRSEYTRVFRRINELNPGDRVYITYAGRLYTYEVTHEETVDAKNSSAFDDDGSGEELIMYTCWPPDSISSRYLVHAAPVGVSDIN